MLVRLATAAMGTRFELALSGADESRLVAAGEAALHEIEDWDRRLSRFRSASLVAHWQARCALEPVVLDPECFELLEECAEVHRASAGAFDVTLGGRMQALGFGGLPFDPADAAASGGAGMDAVQLDRERRTLAFARPGVRLDFGAIGKGHALDRAGEVLRAAGVRAAFLHGGTSAVLAIGAPPGEASWNVLVRTPSGDRIARLRDAALAVSAPHGRAVSSGGRTWTHVLEPQTGESAAGFALAAVAGPSARTCDAWATALLVRGELERAPAACTALVCADDPGIGVRIAGAHPELFEPRPAAVLEGARA